MKTVESLKSIEKLDNMNIIYSIPITRINLDAYPIILETNCSGKGFNPKHVKFILEFSPLYLVSIYYFIKFSDCKGLLYSRINLESTCRFKLIGQYGFSSNNVLEATVSEFTLKYKE